MATYGLQATPSQIAFTGYSNTLGSGAANQPATVGAVYCNGVFQHDDKIAKVLRNGGMSLAMRQLLITLMGAATGATATKTKPQVQAQIGAPGGLVTVEVVNLVNRVTTAADVTTFLALLNRNVFPATYAPDLSGNGGGGKILN